MPVNQTRARTIASRGNATVLALTLLVLLSACEDGSRPDTGTLLNFVDVTADSGVDFVATCGSPDKGYIIDAMGSGVALFDYDLDGDLDVYLVRPSTREHVLSSTEPEPNHLYRNDGDLHFTDVTKESGAGHRGFGQGVSVADIDSDGDLDLYLTNWGEDAMLRNEGNGTFSDVTGSSGLGNSGWGVSSAFADYDLDGDMDLYVSNYLDFDYENPPPPGQGWKGVQNFSGPQGLVPQRDVLYRNRGDGTFEDVTRSSGVGSVSPGFGLGVVWLDADRDGDPDLYVANDTTPNYFFENDGGTFHEIGVLAGLAYNGDGAAQAGMGVASGDANGDGWADLFVTNFAFDTNTLYRRTGDMQYDAEAATGDLRQSSFAVMSWGTGFADLDSDGDEDLVVVNGHLYPTVDESEILREMGGYRQLNHLYENNGGAGFSEVGDEAGNGFAVLRSSRGLAFGDLDSDGDVDLVITNIDGQPTILRNDTAGGNWLAVEVVSDRGNRHGTGALVKVSSVGLNQVKEVGGGFSYLSHSGGALHFGLGTASEVTVAVTWPDGHQQTRANVAANQRIEIRREDE